MKSLLREKFKIQNNSRFKTLIGLCFFSVASLTLKGQISVFVAPGLMNYGGDLQPYYWALVQSNLSFSAGASIQLTRHINVRSELTYGKLRAYDKQYSLYPKRNLSFYSHISEINFCVEYDIISPAHKFNPYFFSGVGLYHFNPYAFTQTGVKVYLQPLGTEGQGLPEDPDKKPYDLTQANIVFGAGFKYHVSDQWAFALEFNSRYLFTDYLDDVSGAYPNEADLVNHGRSLAAELSFRSDELDPSLPYPDGKHRGNSGATDNYYTSMVKVIYTIPLSGFSLEGDGEGRHRKKDRFLNCPRKF
jgi:hypothetical protein